MTSSNVFQSGDWALRNGQLIHTVSGYAVPQEALSDSRWLEDLAAHPCLTLDGLKEALAFALDIDAKAASLFVRLGQMHETAKLSAVPASDELGPDYFKDFPAI